MTEPRPPADYYGLRAVQERSAADRSDDPVARRIHLELADRYAALTAQGQPAAG